MAGWGASITGLAGAVDVLQQLQISIDDDTVYVAGPTVEYAVYVDQGTSKMEARPFVQPAAERVQANLVQYVNQYMHGFENDGGEAAIRAAALAVEAEMKRIITQKGAVDTGTMRGSVTTAKIQ